MADLNTIQDALDNILFDANGNIITNESFEKYKTTIDDYYRFELNKYL